MCHTRSKTRLVGVCITIIRTDFVDSVGAFPFRRLVGDELNTTPSSSHSEPSPSLGRGPSSQRINSYRSCRLCLDRGDMSVLIFIEENMHLTRNEPMLFQPW